MKTLLILTHTQASKIDSWNDDWFRPLSKRGKRKAIRTGRQIIARGLVPDLILTSSAVRADLTACLLAREFDPQCSLYSRDSLYLAEMEDYYHEIQKIPDRVRCLLVVGHNPNLNRLLQALTERAVYLPQGEVAHVQVKIDSWENFKYDVKGRLIETIRAATVGSTQPERRLFSWITSSGLSDYGNTTILQAAIRNHHKV